MNGHRRDRIHPQQNPGEKIADRKCADIIAFQEKNVTMKGNKRL